MANYVGTGYVVSGYVATVDNLPSGYPPVSDVRLGVTYGPTSTEYTGTYVAPPATVTAVEIAAAVIAASMVTPIYADTRRMNGTAVLGSGVEADKWRGS